MLKVAMLCGMQLIDLAKQSHLLLKHTKLTIEQELVLPSPSRPFPPASFMTKRPPIKVEAAGLTEWLHIFFMLTS